MVAFTSCDTDAEGTKYSTSGTEVAFASTQMNIEVAEDDNGIIKVPVYRGNTSGEASVNISMDDEAVEEGVFTLSNPAIAFANGEAIAYAELNFGSVDKLSATGKYKIVLTIDDKKALSPSQCGEIAIIAQRKLTWEDYGTGVYTSELFEESWEQPILKAQEGNIYKLPDCITKGYPIVFTLSADGQSLLNWDIQATGYKHSQYGMVYFSPTGMQRQGNTLFFPMLGAIILNGEYRILYSGFTETLEMPK